MDAPGLPASPAGRSLIAMAPVARLGFLVVGVASGLHILSLSTIGRGAAPAAGLVASAAGALASLAWYGGIGWLAGRLLPAAAELLSRQRERAASAARTTDLVEHALIPALRRLADALERPAAVAAPSHEAPARALAEVRQAIREAEWRRADDLVHAFVAEHPEHPEAPRIAGELDEARRNAAQGLLARIDAAREANDPERVLDLRAGLAALLQGDPLRALDRDLARWLMSIVQRRLLARNVRPDLATLVGRIAETLDNTPEGASLRAALPTLRRSAGLCARCAQPYTGVADACPNCLSTPSFPGQRPAPPDEPAPPQPGPAPAPPGD